MPEKSELLSALESDNSDKIMEVLENADINSFDEATLKGFCSLITCKNKGIQNYFTMLLANSENRYAAETLMEYISSPELSVRNLAGEILIKIGEASNEPLLNHLKQTQDVDEQKFIIDLIGLKRDLDADKVIIEVLNSTSDDNVKLACIEALGSIGSADSIQNLKDQYYNNPLYQPTIIEALGKIGNPEILDFMMEVFKDADELTKYSIIESLGLIGDESTFFFLTAELNSSIGPLSWVIVNSLQLLKDKFQLELPFDEKIKNAILRTINEAPPEYKKAAVFLVTEYNDKEFILAYLKILGHDSELDEFLRYKIIDNKEVVLSVLPKLLKEAPQNVSSLLYLLTEILELAPNVFNNVLKGFSYQVLIDALSEFLTFPDEEVRRLAATLLFSIDYKTALLFSDKMINDDNVWNKLKLIDLLSEINDPFVAELLKILSTDDEVMISNRARALLQNTVEE